MNKEEKKKKERKGPVVYTFYNILACHGNSLMSLIKINVNDLSGFVDQLFSLNSTNPLVRFNLNQKIVKVQLLFYVVQLLDSYHV